VHSTIWIVDDSPTQAAYTQRSLGDANDCQLISSGELLIERLACAPTLPDLVVLDWVMPGMSGDEVCRHLRAQPRTRELPIVMLTASRIDTDDIVRALDGGANDYVAKPFAPAELRARVATIVRAASLQRAAEHEHQRILALNRLAQALLAAESVEAVLQVMSRWLVDEVGDACAVVIDHQGQLRSHAEHRSDRAATAVSALLAGGPRLDGSFVVEIPIRTIASAKIAMSHETASYTSRDLLEITTCLEYSAIALEAALRSERERATTRFHQEMVGIVGHDLRGPLSAFSLGLGLLQETADAQTRATLVRLGRSSKRMQRIVDQLLDVTRARIGAGMPMDPKRIGLRSLVRGVLDEMRLARPESSFELTGDEIEGSWDRDRIEQVVSNLVGNAAQYGRRGDPIELTVSTCDGAAHLRVHNTNKAGPIPPETIASMFDPFARGTHTERADGLGLGLYIVQQIVNAHSGVIRVTSNQDGTTFDVQLPIALD
jgi:signal transduction histidine kinase